MSLIPPAESSTAVDPDDEDENRALLEHFGYHHNLRRALGDLGTFAATFTLISVVVGLSIAYATSYAYAGPGLAWSTLVVLAGMLLVSMVFAELAARYPIAGSIYQWPSRLVGSDAGWLIGWTYLVAWIIVIASIGEGLQITLTTLSPNLEFVGHGVQGIFTASFATNATIDGIIVFVVGTLINLLGVRFLRTASIIGLASEGVAVGMLIVVLAIHARRGPGVITQVFTAATVPKGFGLLGALFLGALLPLLQLFGQDEATQLAEETRSPRKIGPRSMFRSIIVAGLLAFVVETLVPMAAPNVHASGVVSGGVGYVFSQAAGSAVGKVFLCAVILCLVTCAISTQSLITRMIFSQARDGHFVFAKAFAYVDPRTKVPPLATIVPGLAIMAVLAINVGNAKAFNAIIGIGVLLIYLAYLGVLVAMLKVRLRREWVPQPGYFHLSPSLGLIVNIGAIAYIVIGSLDLIWPRAYYYGPAWYQQFSGFLVPAAVITLGVVHLTWIKFARRKQASVPSPVSALVVGDAPQGS